MEKNRRKIWKGKKYKIKGIFSDFNNILLCHESEDINNKSLFPKFQLIPILHFSSYAWLCVFHYSHRLLWKLLSFHTEIISASFLWASVLLRGELRKYAKNSNFESALYSTSGRVPVSRGLFFFLLFFFFFFFTFWNHWNLFWVYQNGNFYQEKCILCQEKKLRKVNLPPLKKG